MRELVADFRGGTPDVCDWCGRACSEDELEPEEAGQWVCTQCAAYENVKASREAKALHEREEIQE
jgi:hypothetical protein